ncbi:hypothetical protein EVAR_25913_1 [Eumeta japonica]|uniref:Uncharacterized protein n=1 Tax=Eumeta variegata TaxID=151549 RepID=A0A4C1W557_EUMVA|nr:hypothetical protein EVAR_25913_1 [Eumeta japonica]
MIVLYIDKGMIYSRAAGARAKDNFMSQYIYLGRSTAGRAPRPPRAGADTQILSFTTCGRSPRPRDETGEVVYRFEGIIFKSKLLVSFFFKGLCNFDEKCRTQRLNSSR